MADLYPQPAPAPMYQGQVLGQETQQPSSNWSQGGSWNIGWTHGYTNSTAPTPQGDPYYIQGFQQGQNQYKADYAAQQGGGGQVQGASTSSGQPPMQGAPQQQEPDWNSIYGPAFNALNQQAGTLQPEYNTQVQEAQNNYTQGVAGAQGAQTEQLGALGLQKSQQETATKGATAQARRMASQMQQGIQARFGGSNSIAQGISEYLGSQATSNIAGNQNTLQQVVAKIDMEANNVRARTTQYVQELEQNTNLAKEKAKNWLNQALAQIATARGQLESEKAGKRVQFLTDYNNTLNQINAENTKFKQQIYLQQQADQTKLNQLKQSKVQEYTQVVNQFDPMGNNTMKTTTTGYGQPTSGQPVITPQGGQNTQEVPWYEQELENVGIGTSGY